MSTIKIVRPHTIDISRGKELLRSIAVRLSEQYSGSFQENAKGVVFKATGVTGEIVISETDVCVTAKLGLLMHPLKSTIERIFNAEIDGALRAA